MFWCLVLATPEIASTATMQAPLVVCVQPWFNASNPDLFEALKAGNARLVGVELVAPDPGERCLHTPRASPRCHRPSV